MIDTHYVVGSRAPFIFRAGTKKSKGNRHVTAIWAVYAGQYAANASNMVQGGAVAASELEFRGESGSPHAHAYGRTANETPLEVFDFTTACYGSMLYPREGGAFGMTKRLTVQYLRPVQPVPGVFKIVIDAKSIDEEKGELRVQASLFSPTSPFDESAGIAGGGGGGGGGRGGSNRGLGADRKGENKERPFAMAEVELIDLRRRKRWKAAYRNKTAGRGRAKL